MMSKITEVKNVMFSSLNKRFKERFRKEDCFKNDFDKLLKEKMNNVGLDYSKPKIFEDLR